MHPTKIRILVTSHNHDLALKFQGKLPLHYEVFPCSSWTEVDEAVTAYRPHLVVEIQAEHKTISVACLRHPSIPFLQLDSNALDLDPGALDEILSQARGRLGDLALNVPLLGNSPAIQKVLQLIRRVAAAKVPVLLTGENGTGKELAAKAIHSWSALNKGPFVPVNCAAIPASLAESELFGTTKGAFTDAHDHLGFVSQAAGGTLFLDEVGELPWDQQAKFLRLLETKDFRRIGSNQVESSDFRLICATNDDLSESVRSRRMRSDFFHRICVAEIRLPSLRERKEDLPLLIAHFLQLLKAPREVHLTPKAMEKLVSHDWPGNVRELKNCLERAIIFSESPVLGTEDFDLFF